MRAVLLILLGLAVGGAAGWYFKEASIEPVRSGARFSFNDRLADAQFPYISATGIWKGASLATKVNAVNISCDPADKLCELAAADVLTLGNIPFMSLATQSFKITHIDEASLTAQDLGSALCIRQTLTFDRVAKAVTMVRTKSNQEKVCDMFQDEPLALHLGGNDPPSSR